MANLKPLILSTGHPIADTVAGHLCKCFDAPSKNAHSVTDRDIEDCDFVIGYGILRGTGTVFKTAERLGKSWFVIDKGYFGANHYDGYYRLGYRGTQGPWKFFPQEDAVLPQPIKTTREYGLICPPTTEVCAFFDIDKQQWLDGAIAYVNATGHKVLLREKWCERDLLKEDLPRAAYVYTFNSGVAWQAIAHGVGAISDVQHSVVGQWQAGRVDRGPSLDMQEARKFVSYLLNDQFTLANVDEGILVGSVESLILEKSKDTRRMPFGLHPECFEGMN